MGGIPEPATASVGSSLWRSGQYRAGSGLQWAELTNLEAIRLIGFTD
jgi:hypothetical protein